MTLRHRDLDTVTLRHRDLDTVTLLKTLVHVTQLRTLVLGLALVACGREIPAHGPSSASADAKAHPKRGTSKSTQEPAEKQRPFRLAWTLQTRPFNQGLALSSAAMAALGSQGLALVDLRSGRIVAEREVCPTFDGAFTFVNDKLGALVCEDKVQLVSLPKLELGVSHALPGRATVAAFSGSRAVIAFDSGPVRIFNLSPWSAEAEFAVDDDVVSLAMSAKGDRVAIGLAGGDVMMLDLARASASRATIKLGLPVETLRFDASAERFFAAAGPSAAVWSSSTLTLEKRFETVSNVLASVWLGQEELGTGGGDGLLLLDVATLGASSLAGGLDGNEPATALVVSPDGKVLCAAQRDGKVACYARGTIPTRGIPAADYGVDDVTMSGRVLAVVDERLTVRAPDHGNLPPAGSDVRVLRYTESTVGKARSTRWIELATARVIRVDGGVVHLSLLGALAEIMGVPTPLAYDTPVRLVWGRPIPKPRAAPTQATPAPPPR